MKMIEVSSGDQNRRLISVDEIVVIEEVIEKWQNGLTMECRIWLKNGDSYYVRESITMIKDLIREVNNG